MPTKIKQPETKRIPKLRFPGFSGAWEEKKLGDFLKNEIREVLKPRKSYKAIGLRSHFRGTFQKLDSDPNKIAMEKLFRVEENDFILNITFAWEGALAIVKKEDSGGLVSHRFPTYIFDKRISSPHYFRYIFPTKRMKYILGVISPGGAGRNRVLNKKDFLKITINLPTIPEQQKIAEFLGVVDEWIENLRTQKESLESYKKGMMQKIFSQEIRFKDDNGKDFPKWEEKRLGDILKEYRLGGNYSNSSKKTDHPLIKMGNLGRGRIILDKLEYVNEDEEIDLEDRIMNGDLFFNTRNTLSLVGKVAIWREELPEAYYNSNIMRLMFECNLYMNYYFNSYQVLRSLKSIATGTTSVAAIYTRDLLKIKLLYPDILEQQKIADFLISIDHLIESKQQQITEAEQWKKGLMQNMFV